MLSADHADATNASNNTNSSAASTGNATDDASSQTTSPQVPAGFASITLVVNMPYSQANFTAELQAKFKKAVAAVAQVDVSTVWINVTDAAPTVRRQPVAGVVVEVKIYGGSSAAITRALGGGDELLTKLNAELTGVCARERRREHCVLVCACVCLVCCACVLGRVCVSKRTQSKHCMTPTTSSQIWGC